MHAHACAPTLDANGSLLFECHKESVSKAKSGMRKLTNDNPTLWKEGSKGVLSSQIIYDSVHYASYNFEWKKSFFRFGAKNAHNWFFRYISTETTKSSRNCLFYLDTENGDFERFFAPRRFFGNHSNKCVVFDKFLLIRQNHNFVSKVKIDCEWNAQMHLLSNGKLVEMETLSMVWPSMVYWWTPKKGVL